MVRFLFRLLLIFSSFFVLVVLSLLTLFVYNDSKLMIFLLSGLVITKLVAFVLKNKKYSGAKIRFFKRKAHLNKVQKSYVDAHVKRGVLSQHLFRAAFFANTVYLLKGPIYILAFVPIIMLAVIFSGSNSLKQAIYGLVAGIILSFAFFVFSFIL